jgi:hypothetical protein
LEVDDSRSSGCKEGSPFALLLADPFKALLNGVGRSSRPIEATDDPSCSGEDICLDLLDADSSSLTCSGVLGIFSEFQLVRETARDFELLLRILNGDFVSSFEGEDTSIGFVERLLLDDRLLGDFSSLSPLAVRRLDFEEDNLEEDDRRSDFDEDNLEEERRFFDSFSPLAARRLDLEEDNLEEDDRRSDFDEDNLEEERCFFDSFSSLFLVDSWSRSTDFLLLLGDSSSDSIRSFRDNEPSESSSFLSEVSALLACLNFFFKNFTVSSSTAFAFALSNGVSPL